MPDVQLSRLDRFCTPNPTDELARLALSKVKTWWVFGDWTFQIENESSESSPSSNFNTAELNERGTCISDSKSAAVFPRSFRQFRSAPAFTRTDMISNFPVKMLNINGVAPR